MPPSRHDLYEHECYQDPEAWKRKLTDMRRLMDRLIRQMMTAYHNGDSEMMTRIYGQLAQCEVSYLKVLWLL